MTSNSAKRLEDLKRFYGLLARIEKKAGGKRYLAGCNGRMGWPQRGVYFFFEEGEYRTTSGIGLRVVRVGTHALKNGSHSTLWGRLKQHAGTGLNSGGNHRGSVFRLHVGTALGNRDHWPEEILTTWPRGSSAPRSIREAEKPYEVQVSRYIKSMPFLWLGVNDAPGPESLRGFIERNAIALLSNAPFPSSPIDPPGDAWLGSWTGHKAIMSSGLWNVNYVFESYSPGFLDVIEKLIS